MKIQTFIFSWGSFAEKALTLEEALLAIGAEVVVIHSGIRTSSIPSRWTYLDQEFYPAKWNESVRLFSADIHLQIMADVHVVDASKLISRVQFAFSNPQIAAYEANVDIGFNYKQEELPKVGDSLYEVPMVDGLTAAIRSDIVRALPLVDTQLNRFGWGIPTALCAICHTRNLKCVRDYHVATKHQKERSYPREQALADRQRYTDTLEPRIQQEIKKIDLQMRQVSVRRFS